MPLIDLITLPSDPPTRALFSFANQDHHRAILAGIYETQGVTLEEFALDPIPDNPEDWLDRHQEMHNDFNAALGLLGYNLGSVDWKDPDQLEAWTIQHYNEHLAAAQKLGLP